MCGIAGFVGQMGTSDALHRMADAIKRRGPDDAGFYESPGVGFAFRRLSIIDLAGGHQPLSNEDESVWVMMNGEIYGFGLIRDELMNLGHRFQTKSDTEVVVHAYEQWGDACFSRLNGMFAIAIWDAKQSRLVLGRDRLGKKPLYYTVRENTIWFASEMKALLASGCVDRNVDLASVGHYLRTDAIPTPRTIFENVQKLESASYRVWQNNILSEPTTFWAFPSADVCPPVSSEQDAIAGLRERIDLSVRERLVSDVPIGLFLSGGLDSAVIAESIARQSSSAFNSFTIGFEEASHDEREPARAVAKALGFEHHETVLSVDEALRMLDEAVDLLDEPLADPAILPQLLLARFTRQHVTVALSGDGGDELLLGYQHIPAHVIAQRLSFLPVSLRKTAARGLSMIPAGSGYFSVGFKAQRFARGLAMNDVVSRDLAWRGAMDADSLSNLLLPEIRSSFKPNDAERLARERWNEPPAHASDWQRWSWWYLRSYLLDDVLVKVDRATMWFALEARAPLLDQRVVSYLLGLPDRFKLGAWKKKRLFKELLRGRISDDVLARPKHGFGIPVAAWLNGPLHDRLRSLTTPDALRVQGWFDPVAVGRLIREHETGRRDRRKELWALLMLQMWDQRWHR